MGNKKTKKKKPVVVEPPMWVESETEEEDWGEYENEAGVWAVDGVVSEEVGITGQSRYEIRWADWERANGTNTTWMRTLPDAVHLIEDWQDSQEDKRANQAKESLEVELAPIYTLDMHRRNTGKRAQAIQEKLERSGEEEGSSRYAGWDLINQPDSSTDRQVLQDRWKRAARKAGATTVTIANDIDGEQTPSLSPNFTWLENKYHHSDEEPERQHEMFTVCDCVSCVDASACECQVESKVVNKRDKKVFAYTKQGLFAFNVPPGADVIECNSGCGCTRTTCLNRVAQAPRDVAVEIFKTADRGWGVRCPVAIPRGKVLGVYTGEVVRRSFDIPGSHPLLEDLPPEHRPYVFDLDGSIEEAMYAVDAYEYGNWTRFINHSCAPNLLVYPVVYDTIPENLPYLAFAATQDIPPYAELTLDYEPSRAKNGKKASKKPAGLVTKCECGTRECCGWMPDLHAE